MRGRVLWLRWRRFSLDVRLSFFFWKVLVLVLGFSGRGVVTFCIWDGVLFCLALNLSAFYHRRWYSVLLLIQVHFLPVFDLRNAPIPRIRFELSE
jgi:hypothetical protein